MKKLLLLLAVTFCLNGWAQCSVTVNSATICAGFSVNLVASGASSYTWMPGGANTASVIVTPSVTTVYTVTGTTGTCTAIATTTVTVSPTPTVDPIPNAFYCPNQVTSAINFSCLPSGGSPLFNWSNGISTGQGNVLPSFTTTNYSSASIMETFTVYATLNGCQGADNTFDITVYPNPVAKFIYSSYACDGQSINFIDQSLPNTGQIMVNQWAWDFNNDGITDSNAENPSFTFFSSGTNLVNLWVYTNSNPSCFATVTEAVFINPLPVINFTLQKDTTIASTWDAYPNYSSIYPSTITSAWWRWGDGDSTYGFYPNHTYANAGSYNICLKAVTDSGCVAIICQNDSVYRLANNNNTLNNMVYVNVKNSAAGISQISGLNSQISIYPNPAQNSLQVNFSNNEQVKELKVLDVLGNEIPTPNPSKEGNSVIVDVSNLQNGVYFIQVKTAEGILSKKIIVQH